MEKKSGRKTAKRAVKIVLLAASLALCGYVFYWMVSSVVTSGSWQSCKQELTAAFLDAGSQGAQAQYQGQVVDLDQMALSAYYNNLMAGSVYRSGSASDHQETITLYLPGGTAVLAPVAGSDDAIQLQWTAGDRTRGFYLRTGLGFDHMVRAFAGAQERAAEIEKGA